MAISNLPQSSKPPPSRRELWAWMMFDFANSGYTTVVLTAVFNTYFVSVIANSGEANSGTSTLLWTITISIANCLVLLSAPVLGAIADHTAAKKKILTVSSIGCILFTAALSIPDPGEVVLTMILVVSATVMFSIGENIIAAFLPEIAPPEKMGRISGYGWTIGYLGGMLVLGLCLAYIMWAQGQGQTAQDSVPATMLIVASAFTLGALPTLLWLRERATPKSNSYRGLVIIGFQRLRETWHQARRYQDLFRFLIALTVYHAGVNTVIVLAAVYAQQVMGFTTQDTIILILVVNIGAAIGALLFGHLQDRIGSIKTLKLTLIIWIIAVFMAYLVEERIKFWFVANLIGIALGASQSAGRALIGQFAPADKAAEFFGLWGLAGKLAAMLGPLTYGISVYLFHGDHRTALLSTLMFFVIGFVLLSFVDERRGKQVAQELT